MAHNNRAIVRPDVVVHNLRVEDASPRLTDLRRICGQGRVVVGNAVRKTIRIPVRQEVRHTNRFQWAESHR